MRRLIPLFLALAVGVTSCSYQLWARVDGNLAAPSITFSAPRIMQARLCLSRIIVTPASEPQTVLWKVEAPEGVCAPHDQVTYGLTPEGFVAKTSATPLRANTLYRAFGVSKGVGGAIQFTFMDGAWRLLTSSGNSADEVS